MPRRWLCPCCKPQHGCFLSQIADTITELKLGNGTSVLIFANIASALPTSVGAALSQAASKESANVAIYAGAFFLTTLGIVYVQEAERKIPMNYASRYRNSALSRQSYLPFKVLPCFALPLALRRPSLCPPQPCLLCRNLPCFCPCVFPVSVQLVPLCLSCTCHASAPLSVLDLPCFCPCTASVLPLVLSCNGVTHAISLCCPCCRVCLLMWLLLQVNATGVMPVIFSSSLLALPTALARYANTKPVEAVAAALNPSGPLYLPVCCCHHLHLLLTSFCLCRRPVIWVAWG